MIVPCASETVDAIALIALATAGVRELVGEDPIACQLWRHELRRVRIDHRGLAELVLGYELDPDQIAHDMICPVRPSPMTARVTARCRDSSSGSFASVARLR
jgi:hypothetical protein